MKYFTLQECIYSATAVARGINISSGYRCPELNKAVGGSSTSAHMSGYAFDQLISEGEDDSGMPRWMHVGYKKPDGIQQRRETMSNTWKLCQAHDEVKIVTLL